jgi:hypothetical protein
MRTQASHGIGTIGSITLVTVPAGLAARRSSVAADSLLEPERLRHDAGQLGEPGRSRLTLALDSALRERFRCPDHRRRIVPAARYGAGKDAP